MNFLKFKRHKLIINKSDGYQQIPLYHFLRLLLIALLTFILLILSRKFKMYDFDKSKQKAATTELVVQNNLL